MKLITAIKNSLLFFLLLTIVLILNHSAISFDMMYPEQPGMYLANQTITNVSDLIQIYLHPKWLHANIPFFRPSGHFLIYQLVTPIIGWHHTKAFILINLFFLALTGLFIIKLYQLLFPPFKAGGYVAFAIYLMHPALSLSRLITLHFEFAYIFFVVSALYFFVLFCRKNEDGNARRNYGLFITSLILYVIAVTFKEASLMLGPLLAVYYYLYLYSQQTNFSMLEVLTHKQSRTILLTITFVTLLLLWYFIQSWPTLSHAANRFNIKFTLGTANAFLKDIFGLESYYFPLGIIPYEYSGWRLIVFPPIAQFVIGTLTWLTLLNAIYLWRQHKLEVRKYKFSLIFLLIASLSFLMMPLTWASAAPWHLSLTLVCLSMVMGFSIDYLISRSNMHHAHALCLIIAASIASTAIVVNKENISKYTNISEGRLGLSLNRNAVLYPPPINSKLNKDSVIVVEDSIMRNDYFLGNAAYPFILFFNGKDYDKLQLKQRDFYLTFHHTYSGSLFRYAYLMPTLKEELYPFKIEKMDDVPNEVIYRWLSHYDNIFCLGYDAEGSWHDKTIQFKINLKRLQTRRQLIIHNYQSHTVTTLQSGATFTKSLAIPDAKLCQFVCDQDKQCKRFIYAETFHADYTDRECYFYELTKASAKQNCRHCIAFEKK